MKKIIIIGGVNSGIETVEAVAKLKARGIEVVISDRPEAIMNFDNTDMKQRLELEKELKLIEPMFSPPPTRSERRKEKRKLKKCKR